MLDKVLAEPRPPIQIAFLQGAIPLQTGACFEKLLGALRGPRGGGGGGGFTAAAGRGSGGARKKEQVAWRRTGSSWLGRRVVLEPADGAAPVAATIDGYRPPAETKVRLDPHGPFVPLFRARFDDAALGVRADLYEADVEHAAAAALAAGLAAADDAQRAAPPAERCAPRIWSVNLGELSFGPLELGRLRDCFGDARCGVTHVFLECNNICCVPYDAESAADGAVREAARAVAARRRAERLDLRGAWKDLFRDLVRANRAKHDLYLLRDGDTVSLLLLPLSGQGYGGRIDAIMALRGDMNTIAGIAVTQHSETPGLGARIEESSWRASFPGTELRDASGELRFRVARGPASGVHEVDGITGATRTGRGVTQMVRFWLGPDGYGPLLDAIERGEF